MDDMKLKIVIQIMVLGSVLLIVTHLAIDVFVWEDAPNQPHNNETIHQCSSIRTRYGAGIKVHKYEAPSQLHQVAWEALRPEERKQIFRDCGSWG